MNRMTLALLAGTLISCAAAPSTPLLSASPEPPPTEQRLFDSLDVLGVTLEAPLGTILREREREERPRHPGTIRYVGTDGEVALPVEVKTRGGYRRMRIHCRFPPLRVQFERGAAKGTLFRGQRRLKLVTHCQGQARYKQYLLAEYLVYRAYNALTEQGFRVRMVEVTYVDSDGRQEPSVANGFLIESERELGKRTKMEELEIEKASSRDFALRELARFELFQYMIGNTDWSVLRAAAGEPCCHNAKLFRSGAGKIVPIPFDFDFAGIIDTHYAEPNPDLSLRDVRKRLYRGLCVSTGELPALASEFAERKEQIYSLYRQQPGLEPSWAQRTIDYLDEFYEVIADPNRMQSELVSKCRGRA